MSDSSVLEVGTEVSAKYRGAFCEATIKSVKRLVKIRISWNKPLTGSATLTQDNVRGEIKLHGTVEAKKEVEKDKTGWYPGTVLKITDASTYTVVFDDGDERTLGRNSVCPQGGKHFNTEMTLDHLPLTNPEIFGTPVIMESKKQRKRRKVDGPDSGRNLHYSEEDVGKVAFHDTHSKKQTLVPVLIASRSQCDDFISTNPGEVIVRSFKSGKFLSIPKEDMVRFDRDTEPLQSILTNTSDIVVVKPALEKALAFYDTGVLPLSWESESENIIQLKEPENLGNTKLRKQFTTLLHEFWERKGCPITRKPSVGYHDLDLYDLYCYVAECGGPETVTQDMKWRTICAQMKILNLPPSGSHTVRNAYNKYVVPFLAEWGGPGTSPPTRRSSVSENVEDMPSISKKKGRVSTPVSHLKGRRTPVPGKRRRNSVKLEDGDSVASSDNTDYEQMPAIHKYAIGQRVKVIYGAPKHCGSYEAKINDRNIDCRTELPVYHIHYAGWNTRYDEWIIEESILAICTRTSKKKGAHLDPPKDAKFAPNRRKIVPKYKRYKKQLSANSETSSEDKNSLAASECSETEQTAELPVIKDEKVEVEVPAIKSEVIKIEEQVVAGHVTSSVSSSSPTDDVIKQEKSPLLCEETFDDMVDTAVSSTSTQLLGNTRPSPKQQPAEPRDSHVVLRKKVEEEKAKEEAAEILMTFPSSFALKAQHTGHITNMPLQLTFNPGNNKSILNRIPISPSKDPYHHHHFITTSAHPTQYLTTNSVRPAMAVAGIAKIPSGLQLVTGAGYSGYPPTYTAKTTRIVAPAQGLNVVDPGGKRIINKPGTGTATAGGFNIYDPALQSSVIKIDHEKRKGRKRKIQQADSTSDIGTRLQQFDFRPDPCEDCDKRPDERPRRAERDKARRGTVKNSDGPKLTGPDRSTTNPPYWLSGSGVTGGGGYVRGANTLPLYYQGNDLVTGGYYVPMRPPGMGPYPPGYNPKFPFSIVHKTPTEPNKDTKPAESGGADEQPSSSGIREPTLAEPDSTVSDEKSEQKTNPYSTPPHSTPSYATPNSDCKNKRTPNIDSDSSDEKNQSQSGLSPGMSPLALTYSLSEHSDKEGSSSTKVKIFDKDFGIHLFQHLELPDKIRNMQRTMAELQKCYLFYKTQLAGIEKKEREKRKSKKRRKSKPRTTSLSKSDKPDKQN